MTTSYTILWKPLRQTGSSTAEHRDQFGPSVAGADDSQPRLENKEIDDKTLAEIEQSGLAIEIAPAMPTKLIEPLAGATGCGDDTWGVEAVGAVASSFSGQGVKIAVLDTGIERNHPAFAGITILEKDFSGDGDGDRNGHGTHCAGTIFGRDVGGVRIGVAKGVDQVLIGKALRDAGGGTSQMIFDAMSWVLQENADVISMSIGFDFPGAVAKKIQAGYPAQAATSDALLDFRKNLLMFDAIMKLAAAKDGFGSGPVVVAASGNESRRSSSPSFRISASLPSAAEGVISVGALQQAGAALAVAEFSNSNPIVCAPGVNIRSAGLGGTLENKSGTSMACPHAAGVAALWAEALRQQFGTRPKGTAIGQYLAARARRDILARPFDLVDYGHGLVVSP